jgi:diaminopimelate epimerase
MKFKDIAGNRPVLKMHGCGNDFLVFCDLNESVTAEMVRKLCSLHFGVGSDGLINVLPSRIKDAEFRMKFYNPDGSTSQMCGNGIRCFAKYLVDQKIVGNEGEIKVDTDAGLLTCRMMENNDLSAMVRINMGAPVLHNVKQIGISPDDDGVTRGKINGMEFMFVSMGNPHAVFFSDHPESDVKKYGALIETDGSFFPERTNVEFVRVLSQNELQVFVWERGAGETLACGTGACASYVAACLNGLTSKSGYVDLPGGKLQIQWEGIGRPVFMTGPAENVFEIPAASLDRYLLKN